MTVRAGREFLAIPGPTTMPDEVLRAMHRPALDIYSDEMVDMTDSLLRDLVKTVRHQGPLLHLHRQRPWRLGSDAQQRAVARRQGAGAGKRPVRDRLGQCRGRHGRRGRSAEGRLAPRDPPRRSRSPAAAGQGPQDQGDPRGAGRYRLGRLSTTSKRSARRSRRRAIRRCSWSMRWPRSAACRSRWTPGASTSRCPARRRA